MRICMALFPFHRMCGLWGKKPLLGTRNCFNSAKRAGVQGSFWRAAYYQNYYTIVIIMWIIILDKNGAQHTWRKGWEKMHKIFINKKCYPKVIHIHRRQKIQKNELYTKLLTLSTKKPEKNPAKNGEKETFVLYTCHNVDNFGEKYWKMSIFEVKEK